MIEREEIAPFDLGHALETLLGHARLIVPFDSGGVLLYDAGTQLLIPRAAWGLDISALDPLKIGQGIVGRVAASRIAIRVLGSTPSA